MLDPQSKPNQTRSAKRHRGRIVVLVVLTLTVCAVDGAAAPRDPRQEAAARAIAKSGGLVPRHLFRYWTEDKPQPSEPPNDGSEGDVLFAQVSDNDQLRHVRDLTELRELRLWGGADQQGRIREVPWTNVTDEGLDSIRRLRKLTKLDLSYCAITDNGLECLKDLTALRSLDLASTRVTDAGLRCLESLPRLQTLRPELYPYQRFRPLIFATRA